jgi:hypothetical protein
MAADRERDELRVKLRPLIVDRDNCHDYAMLRRLADRR